MTHSWLVTSMSIGVGTWGGGGVPGALAPLPSFQSVPYISCTTNEFYVLCPPNQKVFPVPLMPCPIEQCVHLICTQWLDGDLDFQQLGVWVSYIGWLFWNRSDLSANLSHWASLIPMASPSPHRPCMCREGLVSYSHRLLYNKQENSLVNIMVPIIHWIFHHWFSYNIVTTRIIMVRNL